MLFAIFTFDLVLRLIPPHSTIRIGVEPLGISSRMCRQFRRYQPQTSAPESVGPRFLLGSAAIIELQQWGHRSLDGRLTP
jgi:hypothetical protein